MPAPAIVLLALSAGLFYACAFPGGARSRDEPTFDDDVEFLRRHTDVVVLGDDRGGRIAVVPRYQGRVMTSTAGASEPGHGWINRDLIASGELRPRINVFGGEDRFWIGPEGGQFAIFFTAGDPFDLEHWQTPAAIDSEPYEVVDRSARAIAMRHTTDLVNFSGTRFRVRIDRTVRLLERADVAIALGGEPAPDLRVVAYESDNRITNAGDRAWEKETGLLSIWILGMFRPSPAMTVVVPFEEGSEDVLGPIVNDEYFGKVPPDRLVIGDGVLYFRGDGEYRAKIGVAPRRAKDVIGSYDSERGLLTVVRFTLPHGTMDYVNSMWEIQEDAYGGDVVNSYNDGPAEPGATPLGPFYELESSSPAVALGPGQSHSHVHRTLHLHGGYEALDRVSRRVLGVSLDQIEAAFTSGP